MEKLIFTKSHIISNEDLALMFKIYDKSKKGNKLILFYNEDLLFINTEQNYIKRTIKNILMLALDEYDICLYSINFFNDKNYAHKYDYKLMYFEIRESDGNVAKNDVIVIADRCYSILIWIYCLEQMSVKILNSLYSSNIGDLLIFPSGWTFCYSIEANKKYAFGQLYS